MLQKLSSLGLGWRFPCPLCRWWSFLFVLRQGLKKPGLSLS